VSTINLAKSYRAYSPQELRELAYQGLLEVNGFDMTDVFEYIFTGYSDTVFDDAYEEGFKDGSQTWQDDD